LSRHRLTIHRGRHRSRSAGLIAAWLAGSEFALSLLQPLSSRRQLARQLSGNGMLLTGSRLRVLSLLSRLSQRFSRFLTGLRRVTGIALLQRLLSISLSLLAFTGSLSCLIGLLRLLTEIKRRGTELLGELIEFALQIRCLISEPSLLVALRFSSSRRVTGKLLKTIGNLLLTLGQIARSLRHPRSGLFERLARLPCGLSSLLGVLRGLIELSVLSLPLSLLASIGCLSRRLSRRRFCSRLLRRLTS
jgi:hypothetical protein